MAHLADTIRKWGKKTVLEDNKYAAPGKFKYSKPACGTHNLFSRTTPFIRQHKPGIESLVLESSKIRLVTIREIERRISGKRWLTGRHHANPLVEGDDAIYSTTQTRKLSSESLVVESSKIRLVTKREIERRISGKRWLTGRHHANTLRMTPFIRQHKPGSESLVEESSKIRLVTKGENERRISGKRWLTGRHHANPLVERVYPY
ncbi:hypothetical protein CDAR_216731 [Caerostris darwini]|uniref:Uncharacterized protein n=1 Tax=Caerostris darwini TaxID=1538125 RepID=A0AAV4QTY3_9ARAC|nr:hypothetical protein CDAR_216731 [Caerostris darwini]